MTVQEIRAFAVLGTKLFVATGGAGIYFTTNNGTNWSAAYTGITNLFVSSFAVLGTNIFAANYAANPNIIKFYI